jgi:hypothetical protein
LAGHVQRTTQRHDAHLEVASVAAGGAETTVDTGDINWSNRQANELSHSPDITVGAFGAGTDTIRNVGTGSVLAAGTVTITP